MIRTGTTAPTEIEPTLRSAMRESSQVSDWTYEPSSAVIVGGSTETGEGDAEDGDGVGVGGGAAGTGGGGVAADCDGRGLWLGDGLAGARRASPRPTGTRNSATASPARRSMAARPRPSLRRT